MPFYTMIQFAMYPYAAMNRAWLDFWFPKPGAEVEHLFKVIEGGKKR